MFGISLYFGVSLLHDVPSNLLVLTFSWPTGEVGAMAMWYLADQGHGTLNGVNPYVSSYVSGEPLFYMCILSLSLQTEKENNHLKS